VTKLDRLARLLRDAKDIVDELTRREVKLSIGGSVHDPADPVGRLLFNVLAMVAEFEADLIRARTREVMAVAKAKGRLRGKAAQTFQDTGGVPGLRSPGRDAHDGGTCRTLRGSAFSRLPCHRTRRRRRMTA
jgi:DNA invertase Pin-like site-specific DNA recombinase